MSHRWPVILYYKFVEIVDPPVFTEAQRDLCTSLGLKGRILIATEGINGTLAGEDSAIQSYIGELRKDERFADIEIKWSEGGPETFPKLSIRHRPEIVTLKPAEPIGTDQHNLLSPSEWKTMIEDNPDVVLVDVRNNYESDAGRFEGAVTCDIEFFRELPGYMEKLAAQKVKMYPSTVASANSTASGEISAGVFSVIPVDNALHAQNAPIKTVIPAQAYGFAYGSAILGWAKNPNAALVAQDFMMSVLGQQAVVGKGEAASPVPNVPGALDISKINLTLIDWDKVTPEGVKAFEARWNSLFGAR
jgi:rhodanese-related sulfurtransferase